MIRNSKSRLVGILYSSDPMTTRDRPQQSRGISQHEHNPRDCQATPTNSNFNSLIYGKESGSTAKIEKTAKRLGLFLSDFNLVRRYLGITLQPFLPECDFPLVFRHLILLILIVKRKTPDTGGRQFWCLHTNATRLTP